MDVNVEGRRQQLQNLKEFIALSNDRIQVMLEKLGWKPNKVLEDTSLITCPLDTAHKIPQHRADQHIEKCSLRKECYDLNKLFLSEPINDPKSSVLIDDYKKIEILSEYRKMNKDYRPGWNGQDPDPKTANRLASTYSVHERLALYDYTVTATAGPPVLPDYDIVHPKRDGSKLLTYEEQLAQERDAKRRRIKYKAIHTSHKNHTEVLRELIEGQMDLYKDWLNQNNTKDNNSDVVVAERKLDTEREHSIASRNSARSDNSRKDQYKSKGRYSTDREKDYYHGKRKDNNNRKCKDDERCHKYNEQRSCSQSKNRDRSRERQRSHGRYSNDKGYKT